MERPGTDVLLPLYSLSAINFKRGAVKKNCEDELNRSILEMEMLYYPKQYLTDE